MRKGRFNYREIQKWMLDASRSMVDDKNTSVVYYHLIGGGLAMVMTWEDGYDFEPNNPYMRKETVCGKEYVYCLNASIRIANSSYFVDDWEFADVSEEGDVDGLVSLSNHGDMFEFDAKWFSKIRSRLLYKEKRFAA